MRARWFAASSPPVPPPRTTTVCSGIGSLPLEGDDLVGPERPLGQLLERGAARALDDLALVDPARIHAGTAETDLGAVAQRRDEHAVQVVVAVREPLPGHRAADRVSPQE